MMIMIFVEREREREVIIKSAHTRIYIYNKMIF